MRPQAQQTPATARLPRTGIGSVRAAVALLTPYIDQDAIARRDQSFDLLQRWSIDQVLRVHDRDAVGTSRRDHGIGVAQRLREHIHSGTRTVAERPGQWFLADDMLAGRDGSQRKLMMEGIRNGQVDDIDVRFGNDLQGVVIHSRHAIALREGIRFLTMTRGGGNHTRSQRGCMRIATGMDARDPAGADHSDTNAAHMREASNYARLHEGSYASNDDDSRSR